MKLDKRLVIMITDSKGSKFINVDMVFKQICIYILIFIVSCGLFSYVSITIIGREIKKISNKNVYMTKQFADMQKYNEELSKVIDEKNEEMALAGDRFENLEMILSETKESKDIILNEVNGDDNLIERIDTLSITALQKSFIMKLIPNGSPLEIPLHVSGPYGKRYHPILHIYHIHTGTDMVAPMNTPVYATADGVVDWANSVGNGGYGKLVKISHSFGFRTYYAHLNDIKVKRGQFVKKGQLVALTGSTGASTGPHLHYEIRFLGQPIEPMNFVDWDLQNFNAIFEKERRISWPSLVRTIDKLMGRNREQLQL